MASGRSKNEPSKEIENDLEDTRTAVSLAISSRRYAKVKDKKFEGSSIQRWASMLKRRRKANSRSGSKESPNKVSSSSSSVKKLQKLLSSKKKKKRVSVGIKPMRENISTHFPVPMPKPKPKSKRKRPKTTKLGAHFDHKKIEARIRRQNRRKAECVRCCYFWTLLFVIMCIISNVLGFVVVIMSSTVLSVETLEYSALNEPWKWLWKDNGRSTVMVRKRDFTQDVLNCTWPDDLQQGSTLDWSNSTFSNVLENSTTVIRKLEKGYTYYFDSVDQFIRRENKLV